MLASLDSYHGEMGDAVPRDAVARGQTMARLQGKLDTAERSINRYLAKNTLLCRKPRGLNP